MSRLRQLLTLFAFPAFLIGLPLIGVWIAGQPVSGYLTFPPRPSLILDRPFSWWVVAGMALFVIVVITPFIYRHVVYWIRRERFETETEKEEAPASTERYPFPWWGWLGLVLVGISWVLAWTRFEWFAPFQEHTFSPLWLSFVLVVNALIYKRRGWSLITHFPKFLFALFLTSALFWWFFEYLNQYVNNWYYTEVADMGDTIYFWQATIPFATVLPAVLSTTLFLLSFKSFSRPIQFTHRSPYLAGRTFWTIIGGMASLSLMAIGNYPEILFPLLWVAPVILWVALQKWRNYTNPFLERLKHGDWTFIWASAVAALICGFFWEMWNFYSLSKWVYSVPWVQTAHIFEMPFLGYAGYLPFGLECIVISDSLAKTMNSRFDFGEVPKR